MNYFLSCFGRITSKVVLSAQEMAIVRQREPGGDYCSGDRGDVGEHSGGGQPEFVTGNLSCSGGSIPSSAHIRISAYLNGRECYTAREYAYCADILCAGNKSLTVRKPDNVIMPVAAGDTLILECGMESPSGEMKKNGYEVQWFFLPEGNGNFDGDA